MSASPSHKDTAAGEEHGGNAELLHALRDRLTACQGLLPELTEQLRTAIQQTEQAVLEIGENFMNVAGRARKQLRAATDLVGSIARDPSTKAERLDATLEALTAETEKLGQDINGIITSLQFQDITRQEIEKVIGRMAQFQQELLDMKRDLGPERASVPGPEGACFDGAGAKRGEHV